MSRPSRAPRRFPLEPLAEAMRSTVDDMVADWPLTPHARGAARRLGITLDQAEEFATRAGLHTLTVWPDLYDHLLIPCADPKCPNRFIPTRPLHKFCDPSCGYRYRSRERARKRAAIAAYDAQNRRAAALRNRRYRFLNRERIAAKERARYHARKAAA